jgi:hypothetical protein
MANRAINRVVNSSKPVNSRAMGSPDRVGNHPGNRLAKLVEVKRARSAIASPGLWAIQEVALRMAVAT